MLESGEIDTLIITHEHFDHFWGFPVSTKYNPNFATYVFAVPIICRVFGEQSLYVNVQDKGLVSITGCCHQGIIKFANTVYTELKYDNDKMYGIYGGLHISPFEDWDPKYDDLVISLG